MVGFRVPGPYCYFAENFKAYIDEGEFVGAVGFNGRDGNGISDDMLQKFMDLSWEVTGFDFLRADFQKVFRKFTGTHDTTFDTKRDASGHGDAYWGALIGFSGIAESTIYKTNVQQEAPVTDAYVEPEYLGYF